MAKHIGAHGKNIEINESPDACAAVFKLLGAEPLDSGQLVDTRSGEGVFMGVDTEKPWFLLNKNTGKGIGKGITHFGKNIDHVKPI